MSEYSTSERQCCGTELNKDYNCIENLCSFTLWNASNACSCLNLCTKYKEEKNKIQCGTSDCPNIINYVLSPCILFGDIISCPLKSFLYCEKCVNCVDDTSEKNNNQSDEIINKQPK